MRIVNNVAYGYKYHPRNTLSFLIHVYFPHKTPMFKRKKNQQPLVVKFDIRISR